MVSVGPYRVQARTGPADPARFRARSGARASPPHQRRHDAGRTRPPPSGRRVVGGGLHHVDVSSRTRAAIASGSRACAREASTMRAHGERQEEFEHGDVEGQRRQRQQSRA
ncbi:hypothetical protein QR78_23170 [Methylobacterium indicum]|uniref:Uncharacterized protein n=1 Tax=Methylobacterium indicum TaxID=1775910 RepID=A0ABR5HDH6_9HYPH|nr:hypothetical protein QR78_23170 [Methylobacterium indicum]KMO24064.1 hypothetical protein QR79_12470 [Methylobacterium indicum]